MAFKKINSMVEAISIGNKKGEKKSVEGYLLGAKYEVGADKKTKKKGNTIFHFEDEKGERFDVWGNASITAALTVNGKVNPQLGNKKIQINFVRMGTAKKGQNAPKICDVLCDESDTLKVKR